MFSFLKKSLIIALLLSTTILGSNPIKISLIERITHFIQWPSLNEEFVIGIYKNKKLREDMLEAYDGKLIHDLPIEVVNIKNYKDIKLQKINLLYFTEDSTKEIDKIIKKINKDPILIITESANDVYQGMHLGFYYKNKRIKFVINQQALENAQLKASYKILKLAKIVKVEK